MVVRALLSKDRGNTMYRVIDANKQGYMTSPVTLIEADKNVVRDRYGDSDLVGFAPIGKNKIALYVQQGEG